MAQPTRQQPLFRGHPIAGFLEHTLLRAEATEREIRQLCAEALAHRFAGVCVNGCRIALVRDLLAGSGVKTVGVIGFPLGATIPAAKADEASRVVAAGADELDMVMNIGALKDENFDLVRDDMAGVVKAAAGRPVKVILECCLLTEEEKVIACRLSVEAGAAFVKTSTGLNKGGATVADVRLLRQTVGPRFGVKAAGGIRDLATACAMLEAGADRLGASASVAIIGGSEATTAY